MTYQGFSSESSCQGTDSELCDKCARPDYDVKTHQTSIEPDEFEGYCYDWIAKKEK